MCIVNCVECVSMVCVLLDVFSANVWCVYGACSVRCVECDRMVCEMLAVLSANVWCVYC